MVCTNPNLHRLRRTMANRGGSGDLAVLGASKRMSLMAYAQLSSRLGGGIVLVIGSILFGAFIGAK